MLLVFKRILSDGMNEFGVKINKLRTINKDQVSPDFAVGNEVH